MRFWLTLWTVLAVVSSGFATRMWGQAQAREQIRIVGRVFDERHRTVEGVEVVVDRREVRAVSDRVGRFQLDVYPADSMVGFRRIGYRPMLFTIHPLSSPTDTILVELVSSPVELPEVIVSASPSKPLRYAGTMKYDDVFLRQKVGLGTLITRDVIERRLGLATQELLQGVPGVRVWNGPPKRIRFARCQDPRGVTVFIDGVRQIPPRSTPDPLGEEPEIDMLSRVDPTDIEMIEVYRGAGEIPGVFHWDGCAVIAIWMRWNK